MTFLELIQLKKEPKEYPFIFKGLTGNLEGILNWPEEASSYVAIIGHPHSLHGGSMQNKVVTTLVRAFKELNIPSLRFNFRGVGLSEGVYDSGLGESEDMLELMRLWSTANSSASYILAGFSFGSFVAYEAACKTKPKLLISIAPPVHHFPFKATKPACPWLIFQGDKDEIVPLNLVEDYAKKFSPPLPIIRFPETSHFFHGKLLELKAELISNISSTLNV